MTEKTSVMNSSGPARSIGTAGRLLISRLRGGFELRRRNKDRRAAFLNLLRLDDNILEDIGVTRVEVEDAARLDKAPVSFAARILRKEEFLPRYVVVKPEYVRGRVEAFPPDVMLNDIGPFGRNIRPWGKGSDVSFFNLTEPRCSKVGLGTNDECVVTIIPKE